MSIEDISAAKVLGEEKAEAGSLWSDVWVYDGGSTEGQGARKGGGGMFRAFVSHHAPTHRLENGKTDFKRICSAWREEKRKPEESEVMRECRARGTAATLAHKKIPTGWKEAGDICELFWQSLRKVAQERGGKGEKASRVG